MKYSIKRQMAFLCIGLLLFMLVAFLFINKGFLEQYYVVNKKNDFKNVYKVLEQEAKKGENSFKSVTTELQKLVEKGNVSMVVMDGGANLIMSNTHENLQLQARLVAYALGKGQTNGQILSEMNGFQIQKLLDPTNKTEYIEMWGILSNNFYFIIRSPLESIRESVALSNRFLAYIGSVVILFSLLLVWYFSKRITEPLKELALLSVKMANLNFEAKYTSGGENEIGVLGASFNAMSERLEQTVSELKNANYELKKDIEQKEKIETMRTEFLGNVSHELKTPIALIQGYAEGLKEGISQDVESREFYCDVIMDEANKMNKMVRNLLALNQLEFGGDEVQFERFNIVDLIRGVLQSSEIIIQQKQVQVRFQVEEAVYVWGDEFKTEQVIRNYVSNALNHVDGDRVIDIKIVCDGEQARISVFNTGTPIPEEDLPHLWDKFYKVDKARTREYGGNGIGLSIVKAIMESFQKQYGVRNYTNGVEFWFELDCR